MGPSSSGNSGGFLAALLGTVLVLVSSVSATTDHKATRKVLCYHSRTGNRTIYDYKLANVHGKESIDWSKYRGNVVLIINVATFCDSTYQYTVMNALQTKFREFRVLGVPCNQFGLQEPGDNGTEILNSLKYVRPGGGFEPNFELTEKIEVNGPNEHPLYTFLKAYCAPPTRSFAKKHRLDYDDLKMNDIRWNFEKFLIDRRGTPVIRYSETFEPQDVEADVRDLLMTPSNDLLDAGY